MADDPPPPGSDGEQLAMFPDDGGEAAQDAGGPRGPGRPTGALNRSTVAWTDYILSRYLSPLDFLAQTYNTPTDQLARDHAITKADALRLQITAAKELAPYVHAKQPVAISVDRRTHTLIISEGDGAVDVTPVGDADDVQLPGPIIENESEENQ